MDDFSVQFPAQMEELRRRVQRDVRKNLRAAKHLLAAQVCFVLALVLVKQSLQHFTPAGFLAARALVSAPLIVLYLAARVDRDAGDAFFGGEKHSSARENTEARTSSTEVPFAKASPVTKERLLTLLNDGHVKWLGALVLLGQAFTALGLARVSVSNAVVLGQLVPVYACLIAVFQGVEKPSFGKFAAIGAGVLGAAVMLDPARMWLSAGNAFLLARAAAFACFLATQAPALHGARAAPAAVAASAQLVAAAAAIALGVPLAVFKSGAGGGLVHGGFDAEAISGLVGSLAGTPVVAWALVVAVAAFSGVAYALTARAEKNTTPVVAACYNSLQPVIALLVLGALGEAPGARNLTGSFLIVAGGFAAVALSTNDRRRWRRRFDNDLSSASSDKRKSEDGVGRRGRTVRGGVGTERGDDADARGGTEIRRQVRRALADAEKNQSAKATPERGGTVRIVRPRADETREPTRLAPMLWTAAWALSMSVCALAGGGLITWSLVWVYWKLLL
jgi:drug/metabolite transporter (DMT)-like permease